MQAQFGQRLRRTEQETASFQDLLQEQGIGVVQQGQIDLASLVRCCSR